MVVWPLRRPHTFLDLEVTKNVQKISHNDRVDPGNAAGRLRSLRTGNLDEILESGSIHIATANEVPYGWVDQNGVAQGIGPDVAIAVLERMGVTDTQWTVTEFGSLIPG